MRYTDEEINLLEHGGYDINTLPERLRSKLKTVVCERCQLPFTWVSNKKYCKECLRYRQIHWRERSKSYKPKGRIFKSFNFVDLNSKIIFCKKQSDLRKYLEDTIPDFKFYPFRADLSRPFMHQKAGWVVSLSYLDPIAAIGEELIKRSTRTYTKEPKRVNKKLTREQILAISKDNRIRRIIAEEYGVSRALINKIHTGELYSHITGIKYQKVYKTSRNWGIDRVVKQEYRKRANPHHYKENAKK